MHRQCLFSIVCGLLLAAGGTTSANGLLHGHSMSVSDSHKGPLADCSDLHIRFDDHDALVRSEEHTITRAEAPVLRVHPETNGGLQVQGWDRDVYSVTACKAAAGDGGDADRILSQISVSVHGGEVTTKGTSDVDNWNVYLLIRAPKSASIELETMNGPISLYGVDGKLTARAKNGPISLHEFSGDAEISAVNGPITISGSSGNVRVHTQNGPISVSLAAKSWSGTGLSADAENGPLTLLVPSDYQSSFVVESRNHAPISCRARNCDSER